MTLAEAIAQTYAAFADMPSPTQISKLGSFGLEAAEERALVSRPLRELSSELMRSYLFDSVYTVGTWDDFRYFLPRLLELLPSWAAVGHDIGVDVGGRLDYRRRQGFPLTGRQQDALKAYALAYFCDQLTKNWFSAVSLLNFQELEPFGITRAELLTLWWTHPAGALVLAQDLLLNGSPPPEWPRADMVKWLEDAFFTEQDEKTRRMLHDAVLILEAAPDA
ncbi:hypothetical protein [Deinococcus sp. Marseille-Q6407]|uniref:hypothetical protein n=1 Tax=Deinococcus sp. Marseille-Q6407 TaxID=2969223 RepID=UPI0021C208D0|nr:hypothetical protein [Deinococcus sp. Marseille-Q6407]